MGIFRSSFDRLSAVTRIADGKLQFGSGSATPDVVLARVSAGVAGLTGIIYESGHGSAPAAWVGATPVVAGEIRMLPTGGRGFAISTRTTNSIFDASERDSWVFLPGGHYETLTSSGNWKCPLGVTRARVRVVGGGGGGGGAGSATTSGGITNQVGGAGGGSGRSAEWDVPSLVAGTNYACVIGAGGTAGSGGAANNNPGTAGGVGGNSQLTGPSSIVYAAQGGAGGAASAGNSSTGVGGGLHGIPTAGYIANGTYYPGQGGSSATTGGFGCSPHGVTIGGSGGSVATGSLGGLGGTAATSPGLIVPARTGQTGSTAGGVGVTATEPGCGGAGGGAGAPGGAGGNGGAGAPGLVAFWY